MFRFPILLFASALMLMADDEIPKRPPLAASTHFAWELSQPDAGLAIGPRQLGSRNICWTLY